MGRTRSRVSTPSETVVGPGVRWSLGHTKIQRCEGTRRLLAGGQNGLEFLIRVQFRDSFRAMKPGGLEDLTGSADYGIWFGIGTVLSLFEEQTVQMLKT